MKKLLVMVIALAVVFGMSAGVMAENYFNGDIDVNVNVAEYVNFSTVISENMENQLDWGVDYADNFNPPPFPWSLETNTAVKIEVDFESFGTENALNDLINLKLTDNGTWTKNISPGGNEIINFSTSLGSESGTAELIFDYQNYNYDDIAADTYTSTITLTVSDQ